MVKKTENKPKKRGNPNPKPLPPGPGRPKGSTNKMTGELKQMILTALSDAGGVDYLTSQAQDNPKAFMSLLGRVLPMTVQGDEGAPLTVRIITGLGD